MMPKRQSVSILILVAGLLGACAPRPIPAPAQPPASEAGAPAPLPSRRPSRTPGGPPAAQPSGAPTQASVPPAPATLAPQPTSTAGVGLPIPTRFQLPTATQSSPILPATRTIGLRGSISGDLSYPSNFIPELRIVAFNASTLEVAGSLQSAYNQTSYVLELPIGTYIVAAYTLDGLMTIGYTQHVVCGGTNACSDHSPVAVVVKANKSLLNIDLEDANPPAGTFPPMP